MSPNPIITPRVEWTAHPGPQSLLFVCPADIILFGGAKGGGKTDGMILWAAQGINLSGYRAIIFRRTFPELERFIIPRSREIFLPLEKRGAAHYDSRNHRWRFRTPDGGTSMIDFGFLEGEEDVFSQQGAQYARIGFDESTMFTESQVRYMLTCLRSPVLGLRRQLLLTTNPVGPGYGWHLLMFVKDRHPLKVYYDAKWPSDGRPAMKSTCFIPATVGDNPTLLARDPNYPDTLRSQAGPIAAALLSGSWVQTPRLALDWNEDIHTCPPFEIPSDAPRWIGIDWGKSDTASAVWLAAYRGRIWAYRDYSMPGRLITPYAEAVLAKSAGEHIDFVVLSHECFADRGMGRTQADQFQTVFNRFDVPLVRSDKDPEGRLMLLREYMRPFRESPTKYVGEHSLEDTEYWMEKFTKEGPKAFEEYISLTRATENEILPRLKIFRSDITENFGCPYLIQSLPLLIVSMKNVRKLDDNQDDHGFDALTYGLKGQTREHERSVKEFYDIALEGKSPDTDIAAEYAWKAAEDKADETSDDLSPVRWRSSSFSDSDGPW